MSINSIIDDYESKKEKYDRTKPNDRIKEVLDFLNKNQFGRWHFAKANFGENFLWSKFDTSEIKYTTVQRQKHYTYQDIEAMKGLNYGQFEFGAEHFCIIMSSIRRGIKTLHVLPMTSLKQKTPSPEWDIVVTKEEYSFLLHDTIIHAGRIQEIGLERLAIKDMRKYLLKNNITPYKMSSSDMQKVKNILMKQFDM